MDHFVFGEVEITINSQKKRKIHQVSKIKKQQHVWFCGTHFPESQSPSWWLFSSTRCCDWNQQIKVPGAERPSGMLAPREAVSDKQRASARGRSSSSRHRLLDWLMSSVQNFRKGFNSFQFFTNQQTTKVSGEWDPCLFLRAPKCRKKWLPKNGDKVSNSLSLSHLWQIAWCSALFWFFCVILTFGLRKSAESKVLKIHSATPPKNGLNAPAEPEKIQPSKLAEK